MAGVEARGGRREFVLHPESPGEGPLGKSMLEKPLCLRHEGWLETRLGDHQRGFCSPILVQDTSTPVKACRKTVAGIKPSFVVCNFQETS